MPASGPYVSPNDELNWKNRLRPTVATIQRRTATNAPNASHDHAGCRRRGDHRNNRAVAARARRKLAGQRTTPQTSIAVPPLSDAATDRPTASATNAPTINSPALNDSSRARPYLRGVGRSRSTP
jgi:hypothetical protein